MKDLAEACRCPEGVLESGARVPGHCCDRVRTINSFLKEAEEEATLVVDRAFQVSELGGGDQQRKRRDQPDYKRVWDAEFHRLMDELCVRAGIRSRGPRHEVAVLVPAAASKRNGVHQPGVQPCVA
jgi:hypothetical protein